MRRQPSSLSQWRVHDRNRADAALSPLRFGDLNFGCGEVAPGSARVGTERAGDPDPLIFERLTGSPRWGFRGGATLDQVPLPLVDVLLTATKPQRCLHATGSHPWFCDIIHKTHHSNVVDCFRPVRPLTRRSKEVMTKRLLQPSRLAASVPPEATRPGSHCGILAGRRPFMASEATPSKAVLTRLARDVHAASDRDGMIRSSSGPKRSANSG